MPLPSPTRQPYKVINEETDVQKGEVTALGHTVSGCQKEVQAAQSLCI